MTARRSVRRYGVCVGVVILLLAAVMAWQTAQIPSEAAYAQVGPAVVPWMVTAMLGVLGVVILVQALTGIWDIPEPDVPLHLRGLAWVSAGLIVNLATISTLGFILASTALFVCVARGFASPRPLRDAAIGFALALFAYIGFDRLLGYEIGRGVIEQLI